MDEHWATLIWSLVQKFGWGWVIAGLAIYLVLSKFDIIKKVFGAHLNARVNEREQNWDDVQDVIKNLQAELARVREWRTQDIKDYEMAIADLRLQLKTAIETIASEQRGNARLRHALNNVLQAYGGMREIYRKRGLTPPPFREFKTLLELGYSEEDYPWLYR